jgi:hypothetical protein
VRRHSLTGQLCRQPRKRRAARYCMPRERPTKRARDRPWFSSTGPGTHMRWKCGDGEAPWQKRKWYWFLQTLLSRDDGSILNSVGKGCWKTSLGCVRKGPSVESFRMPLWRASAEQATKVPFAGHSKICNKPSPLRSFCPASRKPWDERIKNSVLLDR